MSNQRIYYTHSQKIKITEMKENREKREINFEICIFADDFSFERKCESSLCFKSLNKQKSFKEDNASLSFHSF